MNPGHAQPERVAPSRRATLAGWTHCGDAVVANDRGQRQRFVHLNRAFRAIDQNDGGRRVHDVRRAAAAPVHRDDLLVDDLLGHQPPDRAVGPAVGGDRPDELLVTPVGRHAHAEGETLAPRIEERRLSPVGVTRLEVVVGTDRDIEVLFVVAVQVPEEHVEAAVGVLLPPFEDRLEILAAVIGLRGRGGRAAEDEHTEDPDDVAGSFSRSAHRSVVG